MYCNYCGKELENNALICHGCGSSTIAGAATASPTPPPSADYVSGPPAKTNGMAIAAMVCGICGFFTCGIAGIVGFILGLIARKKMKATGEGGKGFAIAGIACGAVSVGFWLLYLVLVVILVVGVATSGNNFPEPYWLEDIYGLDYMLNTIRLLGM